MPELLLMLGGYLSGGLFALCGLLIWEGSHRKAKRHRKKHVGLRE